LTWQIYRVEKTARKQGPSGEQLRLLRKFGAKLALNKLRVSA
jgi:hypothetical protein